MNSMYYDKNDQPIEGSDAHLVWAKQFENLEGRIVKQQTTWLGFWVSTVWLGLDHGFGWGKPLIYETMVFRGISCDLDTCRYSTREEAVLGHKRMFLRWSDPLFVFHYWEGGKTMRCLKRIWKAMKDLWYRFWHENPYCRW